MNGGQLWITCDGMLTACFTGPVLAPRRRSLAAFDVCTARALRAEITRHQPARAITYDPFPQYELAPFGYLTDGAR